MPRWRWAFALLIVACAEPGPMPSGATDSGRPDANQAVLDAFVPTDAGHDSGPLDAGETLDATIARDAGADASQAADASVSADGGRWWGDAACSPLPQAGCADGEACTLRLVAGAGWVAACEPAGTLGAGRGCTHAASECAAGLFCFNSRCWRFCEVGTAECTCASLEDPTRPNLGRCR